MRTTGALLLVIVALAPVAVDAQGGLAGHVAVLADVFPNRGETAELRAGLFAEQTIEPSPLLRVTLSGFAEGLVARRPLGPPQDTGAAAGMGAVRTAVVRVHDAHAELRTARLDVLAGFARVAWGKLDELQPTDVVNPLDVSRFFLEGRSEARLPVALLRGRLFLTADTVVEAIYAPAFRRGRFDQLDEDSSPFNPISGAALPASLARLPLADRQPGFGESQGGTRLSTTTGRVDWSVSAYRGFEPFGLFAVSPFGILDRTYPRFTMIGGDFETVRGEWGIRGEVAAFLEDHFQSSALTVVRGRSFDAGAGVDRRAGDYRVSATVLFHGERHELPLDPRVPADRRRDDLSFIGSADRSFSRERYRVRAFAVYNATEGSSFARAITTAALRDNVALEASAGWFAGDGADLIGRFADSDFVYARVKYYF